LNSVELPGASALAIFRAACDSFAWRSDAFDLLHNDSSLAAIMAAT
jgi:hypothetical protein